MAKEYPLYTDFGRKLLGYATLPPGSLPSYLLWNGQVFVLSVNHEDVESYQLIAHARTVQAEDFRAPDEAPRFSARPYIGTTAMDSAARYLVWDAQRDDWWPVLTAAVTIESAKRAAGELNAIWNRKRAEAGQ